MNRTDRLLGIVLELQAQGTRRAEDLAATFEISRRTVYRDMQALSEAGVPVVAVPGEGYSLMEGYFLPPLRFTIDEATMLVLGSEFMADHFDAQYRAAALSASLKVAAVLRDTLRAQLREAQNSIHFVEPNAFAESGQAERLQQLRRAVIQRRTVRFQYHARFGELDQPRRVDAYGITHVSGAWYLVGYDHNRRAQRIFRLDRMEGLAVLNQTFARPADFRLGQLPPDPERKVVVRALFDAEMARWVREARYFFVESEEETPAGLLVTLTVRHEREPFQWLLGWGSHVRVLEPASLRALLRAEAEKMARNFAER